MSRIFNGLVNRLLPHADVRVSPGRRRTRSPVEYQEVDVVSFPGDLAVLDPQDDAFRVLQRRPSERTRDVGFHADPSAIAEQVGDLNMEVREVPDQFLHIFEDRSGSDDRLRVRGMLHDDVRPIAATNAIPVTIVQRVNQSADGSAVPFGVHPSPSTVTPSASPHIWVPGVKRFAWVRRFLSGRLGEFHPGASGARARNIFQIGSVRGVTGWYRERNDMCRNIKTLFNFEPATTAGEIREASLQFVRKGSGFGKPSHANEAAFNRAVVDVAAAVRNLLDSLVTGSEPRNREIEAARARARAAKRLVPEPRR